MGNRCCTDRKPATRANDGQLKAWGDNLARDASEEVHRKHNLPTKSIVAFDNQKQIRSTWFLAQSDDADKFDRAFEANDIAGLVALLPSRQPIEGVEEKMHPWAQDPQTVGALAGTQLSVMAHFAVEEEDPQMKINIGKAGAIVPLVDFLRSGGSHKCEVPGRRNVPARQRSHGATGERAHIAHQGRVYRTPTAWLLHAELRRGLAWQRSCAPTRDATCHPAHHSSNVEELHPAASARPLEEALCGCAVSRVESQAVDRR